MTTYISPKTASRLAKLAITFFLVILVVIAYVLWQSYEGRVDLVNSTRSACERGKIDRSANASGWRTAEMARLVSAAEVLHISIDAAKQTLPQKPLPNDPEDLTAARRYSQIAAGLEERSRINCVHAFPNASFFP